MDFLDDCSSGRRWRTHLADRFDLAIALEFDGPQPRLLADESGLALATESACVPDAAAGGRHLPDLQVPALAADAAPSRPLLYRVREVPP